MQIHFCSWRSENCPCLALFQHNLLSRTCIPARISWERRWKKAFLKRVVIVTQAKHWVVCPDADSLVWWILRSSPGHPLWCNPCLVFSDIPACVLLKCSSATIGDDPSFLFAWTPMSLYGQGRANSPFISMQIHPGPTECLEIPVAPSSTTQQTNWGLCSTPLDCCPLGLRADSPHFPESPSAIWGLRLSCGGGVNLTTTRGTTLATLTIQPWGRVTPSWSTKLQNHPSNDMLHTWVALLYESFDLDYHCRSGGELWVKIAAQNRQLIPVEDPRDPTLQNVQKIDKRGTEEETHQCQPSSTDASRLTRKGNHLPSENPLVLGEFWIKCAKWHSRVWDVVLKILLRIIRRKRDPPVWRPFHCSWRFFSCPVNWPVPVNHCEKMIGIISLCLLQRTCLVRILPSECSLSFQSRQEENKMGIGQRSYCKAASANVNKHVATSAILDCPPSPNLLILDPHPKHSTRMECKDISRWVGRNTKWCIWEQHTMKPCTTLHRVRSFPQRACYQVRTCLVWVCRCYSTYKYANTRR